MVVVCLLLFGLGKNDQLEEFNCEIISDGTFKTVSL
jgi:hypothetical protein